MSGDVLYEAMKLAVKTDEFAAQKIKTSPQHDLYKKCGEYFWSAFYAFCPMKDAPEGTQGVRIDVCVKYWRYDELKYKILHPGKEMCFTDKVRANSVAACRAELAGGQYAFAWDGTEAGCVPLCREILNTVLETVQTIIHTAEVEYGGLDEYLIAHPELAPQAAGLAHIDRGEYEKAEQLFAAMDGLRCGFYLKPETPKLLARMRENAPEREKGKNVFWRDDRDILLDYCRAMRQGLVWDADAATYGPA